MCSESEKAAAHFRWHDQEQSLPQCTALGTDIAHGNTRYVASPVASQAERGHRNFQERDRRAQRHQNRKHFDKEKPLLEVQSRASIKEGQCGIHEEDGRP